MTKYVRVTFMRLWTDTNTDDQHPVITYGFVHGVRKILKELYKEGSLFYYAEELKDTIRRHYREPYQTRALTNVDKAVKKRKEEKIKYLQGK